MEFSFVVPSQIIFGCGTISRLPAKVKDLKARRPLIATSRGMMDRPFARDLLLSLKSAGIACEIHREIHPEPSMADVENCLQSAVDSGTDLIIGLGGGSVMDVAKKVAMDIGVPKIMLPTTAGTGSEVTHESVFKVQGKKRAFVDIGLTPDIAIVDSDMLATVPLELAASSGIDCLAHAVECYTSRRSNVLTKTLAWQAYNTIKNSLRKAVEGDKQARDDMALGSLIAGMAFGNSGTTLAHALSYPLSNAGIPHGEAVAMVLPYALEFNDFDREMVREIKEIIASVGLGREIKGDIEQMAHTIMEDERHLSANPREVGYNDVLGILKNIVGENEGGYS